MGYSLTRALDAQKPLYTPKVKTVNTLEYREKGTSAVMNRAFETGKELWDHVIANVAKWDYHAAGVQWTER